MLIPASPVRYSLGRGTGEGGSPGRAAASSWGHPADPRRHSAGGCVLPSSPSPLLFTPARLGGFLAPGPADARSPPPRVPHRQTSLAPRVGNPVGPGPAPAGEGSYLCPLTPPLAPVHSLAVILALLLPLGNHAAAETLSALGTSAFTLRTSSTGSRPRRPVLAGMACSAGVPPPPRATRQRPPREQRPFASALKLISRDNYPGQSADLISLDKAHR